MKRLVSANWLANRLGSPDLVLLDCTNYSRLRPDGGGYETADARADWMAARIPGSQLADFNLGLSGPDKRYRNTLPQPQQLVTALARLGVGAGRRIVLYDRREAMSWAARVWWMLRWIGFDHAALLDGGWQAWLKCGAPVVSGPADPPDPGALDTKLRSALFTGRAGVIRAQASGAPIIDGLSAAQFNGTASELGLSGHIPGARNLPATALIDPTTGRFLPKQRLRRLFPENPGQQVIVYCGSGIAAASLAFTMTRLGYRRVSIYMPGLQEWLDIP